MIELSRLDQDRLQARAGKSNKYRNRTKGVNKIATYLISEGALAKDKNSLQWFVTNALQMVRFNKSAMSVRLDRNTWVENEAKIKYTATMRVINWLEQGGYIDIYKGYNATNYKVGGKAAVTILSFSDKLLGTLRGVDIEYITKARLLEDPVVLRDRKTREKKNTRSIPQVKVMRKFLWRYNDLVSTSPITFFGAPLGRLEYKRVFTDKYSMGGRFYLHGGGVQLVSGTNRLEYIKINNNSVVELDYSSIHANLLYERLDIQNGGEGKLKVELGDNFKPYGADISEYVVSDLNVLEKFRVETDQLGYDPLRNLCKMALMICLNSPTKAGAYKALLAEYSSDWKGSWEERKFVGVTKIDATAICKAVQAHNKIIGDYFFSDAGIQLQALDSAIAEFVIKHFLKLEIPVLPWHDSFVVEEEYKEELHHAMELGWEIIMGQAHYCEIDSK